MLISHDDILWTFVEVGRAAPGLRVSRIASSNSEISKEHRDAGRNVGSNRQEVFLFVPVCIFLPSKRSERCSSDSSAQEFKAPLLTSSAVKTAQARSSSRSPSIFASKLELRASLFALYDRSTRRVSGPRIGRLCTLSLERR